MTLRGINNIKLLSEINKHEFDHRIRFRAEGHKYWIDGDDKDLISCTTHINTFIEPFQTDEVINNIIAGNAWKNDPSYIYYQMSFKDIKDSWGKNSKTSSESGTNMHELIEHFYNGIEIYDKSVEFGQFLDFYKDNRNLKMYRTEWMIFSDVLKITGAIDAVFKNEDGTLTLGDWKR